MPAMLCVAVSAAVAVITLDGTRLWPAPHNEMTEAFPGFTAVDVPNHGLIVTSVETASPAERAGLASGDRIAAINTWPVESRHEAQALLGGPTREQFELAVVHNHHPRHIVVSTAAKRRTGEPENPDHRR